MAAAAGLFVAEVLCTGILLRGERKERERKKAAAAALAGQKEEKRRRRMQREVADPQRWGSSTYSDRGPSEVRYDYSDGRSFQNYGAPHQHLHNASSPPAQFNRSRLHAVHGQYVSSAATLNPNRSMDPRVIHANPRSRWS